MIYAIGDIHGHLDQLAAAHALIAKDRAEIGQKDAKVVHIGDLVDRGPDSKGVVQYLIDGLAKGEEWVVLRGNHDQMFLDFIGGDDATTRLPKNLTWQHNRLGGKATLQSYGVKRKLLEGDAGYHQRVRARVPKAHVDFLKRLPLWHRAKDMIFVHAGIRPGFPIEAQDEEDLLWIRDEFLWHHGDHEALIVHGHTPVDEPTHYGNRVNIDTGAGWGNDLVPVVFDDGACFALLEGGRARLKVPRK
ncbi:MAG: serine/threonine protein phosphatase [Silicimonas sp.]|nr:serine/threonine protein phosphatase [Silicimonas sp.]